MLEASLSEVIGISKTGRSSGFSLSYPEPFESLIGCKPEMKTRMKTNQEYENTQGQVPRTSPCDKSLKTLQEGTGCSGCFYYLNERTDCTEEIAKSTGFLIYFRLFVGTFPK